MTSLDVIFAPPETVRNLKILDRDVFTKIVKIPAVCVPSKHCTLFLQHLKEKILKFPGVKKVVPGNSESEKFILLLPEGCGQLTDEEREWITSNEGQLTSYDVVMKYNNYNINATLKAILPITADIPSAYETIGHIAHLNLRQAQLPYKEIIGQVLLDKLPNIRSVVNKANQIDDTYRTFHMELLAGDNNMIATVKENGCIFKFDFSKVYWNSRLHTEHKRIIDTLGDKDIVVDMFAGVGPFAVPACKKGCRVFANDLNPSSYTALVDNAKRNNVTNQLTAYNLDGRDFVKQIREQLVQEVTKNLFSTVHVIMNLPACAVEFLDCLTGLYHTLPTELHHSIIPPQIHCYYFSKSADPESDTLDVVQTNLGTDIMSYEVHVVRDVAPNKLMMRISFTLPQSVLFVASSEHTRIKRHILEEIDDSDSCQPPFAKKNCLTEQ